MYITKQINIETSDGTMPAFEASPDAAPKGAAIVIQEAFGVTFHIEEIACRLATAGWYAVAPALFHRQGSPVLAYDDIPSVMPLMAELSEPGIRTDVDATLAYLLTLGFTPAQTGIVGFCMGGSVSLYAAATHSLGAAVTFYGGGVTESRLGLPPLLELAPNLLTPWLGLFGDLDESIPIEDVELLTAAAASGQVSTDVVRYSEANHGFNCNDRPAVFHPVAAADAWVRTLEWLDSHANAGN